MNGHTLTHFLIYPAIVIIGLATLGVWHFRGAKSDEGRFERTKFRNIHSYSSPGFGDFLKWRWNRLWQDIPPAESYVFPVADNDSAFLKANRAEPTVTWIGHATVLVQMKGRNILTDPHFSERASPVQFAGPKRVVRPGLAIEDLPPIDLVVLSHDHYDSLDYGSVRRLAEADPDGRTVFAVPLGLGEWFRSAGAQNVVEFDWWESRTLHGLEVTAVPVHHWSQRVPFSRNSTLWAGWVVRRAGTSFFFAGDSGYTPIFKEIGDRLGPFDLAAIPIGAYEPRWFMRRHHMNPEEAVRVHTDVRASKSVAIHWGTFMLTDEPLDEPPRRLEAALKAEGLGPDDFVVLRHGETLRLGDDGGISREKRVGDGGPK